MNGEFYLCLALAGIILAMLAMFFNYNLKLDKRTLTLEKKNGHEQDQINQLKKQIKHLEEEIHQLREAYQESESSLRTLKSSYQASQQKLARYERK